MDPRQNPPEPALTRPSSFSSALVSQAASPDLPPHYFDQSRRGSRGDKSRQPSQIDPLEIPRSAPNEVDPSAHENVAISKSSFENGNQRFVAEKDFGGLCTRSVPGSDSDPEQEIPHHVFGKPMIWTLIALVSVAGTLSGFSTNIFFPAQDDISQNLHISIQTVNLSITTYIIGQAIAPSFWGPLADFTGRRVIFLATLTVYAIANLGLALTQNSGMLLGFRLLQAIGSSSTIALGAGVIADISTPAERGGYLGLFSGTRQMSIAFGPVLGGVLASSFNWRAIFWFLLAITCTVLVLITFFLPETLRRIAGNGSTPLTKFQHRPLLYVCLPIGRKAKAKSADPEEAAVLEASSKEIKPKPPFSFKIFVKPLTYLFEKDVACALFFGACVYTSWSMMMASTTILFKGYYGFSTLEVGLAFLANGIGCVAGSIITGRILDNTFHRETSLYMHSKYLPPTAKFPKAPLPLGFPLERARLGDAPIYSAVMIVGLLIYGWSMTTVAGETTLTGHWLAPLLAQFMIGYSNTAILNSNNTLVVDLYPGKGASASAVVNLSRGIMAAAGVAVVDFLLEAMSPGYMSVVLVGLVLLGLLPYCLHVRYGGMWRRQREERNGSVAVSPM